MYKSGVSLVIPCYNESESLINCVNSVLSQKYLPNEIIIIDDCSENPQTRVVLKKLEQKKLINVIYCSANQGPGIARNIGINSSISEWIVLLDADDILLEDAIENILKCIRENPMSDFIFWNYTVVELEKNEQKLVSTKEVCLDGSPFLDPYKLAKNFILPGCSSFKKDLWKEIKGYDPILSKGGVEDIDFWRRAVLHGAVGIHINKILYQWNRNSKGNNSNIDESKYLIHRIKMLSYYDKYNPEYALKIRGYIYRFFSARLMAKELNAYLKDQKSYYSKIELIKAKLLYFKLIYKAFRLIKNKLYLQS